MALDPTTLTDTELEDTRQLVVYEQIRRAELALLPEQIDAATQRFVDHGGDKTKLKDPKAYEKAPKEPKPPKDEKPSDGPVTPQDPVVDQEPATPPGDATDPAPAPVEPKEPKPPKATKP